MCCIMAGFGTFILQHKWKSFILSFVKPCQISFSNTYPVNKWCFHFYSFIKYRRTKACTCQTIETIIMVELRSIFSKTNCVKFPKEFKGKAV